MEGFFPVGFWPGVAMFAIGVCLVFGLDLLFGAKLLKKLGSSVNRRVHVDKPIVDALDSIKKVSDKEFDVDNALTTGMGRFILSGLLFVGALMVAINILPNLK